MARTFIIVAAVAVVVAIAFTAAGAHALGQDFVLSSSDTNVPSSAGQACICPPCSCPEYKCPRCRCPTTRMWQSDMYNNVVASTIFETVVLVAGAIILYGWPNRRP